MIEMYKKVVFENYVNFNGRARRKEFWYFSLCSFIIAVILGIVDQVVGLTFGVAKIGILGLIYNILVLIPNLSVGARRLHDVGKSGWLLLILFVPLLGALWLLVLFCTEGEKGPNQYGADPKNQLEEINEIGKE